MSVNNYQKYRLSKHAQSRVKSRFNITEQQTNWALNVLKNSKMKNKVGGNAYTVTTGNIEAVIDTNNHSIVTIYPCSNNELDKEFMNVRELELRSYTELKEYAQSSKSKKLAGQYKYISTLYNQLSKTQSRELMQELLVKITETKQKIEMINTQLVQYCDFVEKF